MKTYGWIRDFVLELINQRSIAGRTIPADYNNQADYLQRIPKLVNMAANEIATVVEPIHEATLVSAADGEVYGKFLRFDWPVEAHAIHTGGFLIPEDGSVFHDYMIQESTHKILVDAHSLRERDFELEYYRYPREIPDAPVDSLLLDTGIEDNCWEAVAFYAAAFLVMPDDKFLYASLVNQYENRVAKISAPKVGTEIAPVEDRYGAAAVYDVY